MQRREVFGALFRSTKPKERPPLFPPYFDKPQDFEKCKECENKACQEVCEENIIVIVDDRPSLDFSESGCTFCAECAKACEVGVLKVEYKKDIPAPTIDMIGCVAWHKTICSMCKDICEVGAIEFTGLFNPEIRDVCNGCGFCVGVCPTHAIGWEG